MSIHSLYLSRLGPDERIELERRLLDRQSGKCFLCDAEIDLALHKELEIDHVIPLATRGEDGENNFALTHSSCNRKKGASDLRVARRLMLFERIQVEAMEAGARGANLGHLLAHFGGAKRNLRLKEEGDRVRYTLTAVGDERIREAPLYEDPLSKMKYFFAVLPIEYVHHDDRINPRNIGANLRGLIEEFQKGRPQLHVGLTWWTPDEDATGPVKMFDGQHKAAAQVLLDVRSSTARPSVRATRCEYLAPNECKRGRHASASRLRCASEATPREHALHGKDA
jgi:HNH endonuclease